MKLRNRLGRRVDLTEQTRAYRLAFTSPRSKQHLLPDLADFCGAVAPSPPAGDLFVQGRAAGRRDVWLRIQQHLNLTEEELMALWKGQPIITEKDFTHE